MEIRSLTTRNKITMTEVSNQPRNQLWLARKRLGLGQKQVAYLLQHKTNDQVSRYEKGERMPGLKLLLQFEIIYGVPPRVLYRDYYEQLQAEIIARANSLQTLSHVYTLPLAEPRLFSEFCSYEELLQHPQLAPAESARIRKHVVTLTRRLSYHPDPPPQI
jgi:transcriptional regulator with XRE-family HTH domain